MLYLDRPSNFVKKRKDKKNNNNNNNNHAVRLIVNMVNIYIILLAIIRSWIRYSYVTIVLEFFLLYVNKLFKTSDRCELRLECRTSAIGICMPDVASGWIRRLLKIDWVYFRTDSKRNEI